MASNTEFDALELGICSEADETIIGIKGSLDLDQVQNVYTPLEDRKAWERLAAEKQSRGQNITNRSKILKTEDY